MPLQAATSASSSGLRVALSVESEAPRQQIEEIEALAAQRCPGVFCMANAIPFETRLAYSPAGQRY